MTQQRKSQRSHQRRKVGQGAQISKCNESHHIVHWPSRPPGETDKKAISKGGLAFAANIARRMHEPTVGLIDANPTQVAITDPKMLLVDQARRAEFRNLAQSSAIELLFAIVDERAEAKRSCAIYMPTSTTLVIRN